MGGINWIMGQEAGCGFVVSQLDSFCLAQGGDPYMASAFFHDAQIPGHIVGEINDPGSHEGAAVIDPYRGGVAVAEVFHQESGIHGQGFVGRSPVVQIVGLAVRGLAAMEWISIPGVT